MCGIAGIVNVRGGVLSAADVAAARAMTDALAHRGPDDAGFHHDDHAALGHRRLSIIDPDPPARSRQPMTDAAGNVLVFNGEIYNFRDLRTSLGGTWRTGGDTEVLLRLLTTRGVEGLREVNGMFALALWQPRPGRLVLAADAFGQKPLYVRHDGERVTFASESHVLPRGRKVEPGAVVGYLRRGYVPAGRPLRDGRRGGGGGFVEAVRLRPGAAVVCERETDKERRWLERPGLPAAADPQRVLSLPPVAAVEAAAVREAVTAAVGRQMVSDVPLGCFLSGGIDSSIVAACAQAAGDRSLRTFCVGFDDPRYDERPVARRVAEHLGTEHHDAVVRPDLARDLPEIAARFGEPFADSSLLPTYYLSRFVRGQGIKVALSGDGGDELFGGYDRYRALNLPWLVGVLAHAFRLVPGGGPKSRRAKLKRLARAAHRDPARRYLGYLNLFDDPWLRRLVPDERLPDDREMIDRFHALNVDGDLPRAAAALDRVTYLPDDLHTKVDRAGMAVGLEVRAPFMDPTLLTIADRLPGGRYVRGGRGKALLRDAFADRLPAEVFDRPKRGFALPIGDWFRGDLRPMLNDLLTRPNGFAATHFDRAAVRRLLTEHAAGTDHGQRLFALLMLELWQDRR